MARPRRRLEDPTPEARAWVQAKLDHWHSPEHRAQEEADRAEMDREMRKTGTLTADEPALASFLAAADDAAYSLVEVGQALRERRRAAGKSLEALAGESGMDQGFLSRLERGAVPNPTVGTLARVAAALGSRITIGVEPAGAEG